MSVKTATWTPWMPPAGKSITGYKIYSDKDGEVASVGLVLTTPITLSDGVVHNVTCRAVYDDASLGLVSNVEVIDLSILFEDDFTGATIDAAKWLVKNTNPSEILIEQNDELRWTKISHVSGGTVFKDDNMSSVASFALADNLVLSFDFQNVGSSQHNFSTWQFGFSDGRPDVAYDNRVLISRSITAGEVDTVVMSDGVFETSVPATLDLSITQSFKIILNATNAKLYYWDGSLWILINDYSHSIPLSNMNITGVFTSNNNLEADNSYVKIDNLTLVNYDYSTLRP